MDKKQLIWKKIGEVKLNPKNPRKNDGAVDAVAKSIEKYGFKNPLIVDANGVVYCGSTLIACEQLGRKCYMLELDPHYCDVIIDRWEKLTGKKAKKIKGEQKDV